MLTGCSHTQTFSSGDANGTVTTDNSGNAKIHVDAKDGTQVNVSTGSGAAYPNLPFPQYPGSSITMSMNQDNQPGGQPANKVVSLETSDAPDKAITFYKSWFSSNSWKINMESTQAGMSTISAQNSTGAIASIMCMPGAPSGKTNIQITLSGK
jgi:hypothetical protein